VNLLLDENLSPRLVQRLASLFPGLIHVRDINLKQASNEEIWNWGARERLHGCQNRQRLVVLTERLGWPPKAIHIEQCNFPFRVIEELLRQNAVRISEFDKSSIAGLLVVRPQLRRPLR